MQDLSLPHVLSTLIMEKRGLILVVGATGSGKSTTLASMIDFRNGTTAGHILTMEDPVEYVFTPKKSIVNQREVGNDTRSFHDALRNAMRQAPDVILIGEIRDLETMRMALTYALSGHLCLATLHANNAYQAMNRVISFFPLEVRPMLLQDLSVSLKAVISQRLIKTIDGKRTPAVEVLLNTRNVQELIEKGEITEIKEAMEKSMSPGSQTFEQDLFRLVRQNKISTDEALANADSATNLGLLLGNSGIMPAATDRAKNPGSIPGASRPGSGFGDFKIEEPTEERLG
jgi:twitching motility protein PilU